MQWIEKLREAGKRIALVDGGVRGEAALRLAGLDEHFEASEADARGGGRGARPRRRSRRRGRGVRRGRRRRSPGGAYLVIAVARGLATPEQLRRAGADAVVAELHELL